MDAHRLLKRTGNSIQASINVLMIVGAEDVPLYFLDLSSDGERDDSPHLDEFIMNAALDVVDSMLVSFFACYLHLSVSSRIHPKAFCEMSTSSTTTTYVPSPEAETSGFCCSTNRHLRKQRVYFSK